ncbi:hypothetical protein KSC_039610 [Ktedonobacter sp. SOSP1-52]|uniref:hypothetical protein n=1 Tax=Ktedonobacter sp. SOSP1-52 TaxID=2778366 RepID=UPI001914DCE5|nr:hypothetical protein [Ktedonobacter sp. SOSP1-52]GHO65069.1 hypothetical protein KSC_039610 [Ktedonobacter sp. SOSP1-52]
MIPKPTFLDRFSKMGRLKQQLTHAQTVQDVQMSIVELRHIQQQLQEDPKNLANLWLPFLEIFLDKSRVRALTENDLQNIEAMGMQLLNDPVENLDTGNMWSLIVQAYNVREEKRLARDLLTRMYHTSSLKEEWRVWAVRTLAQYGAKGDDHVKIYIDYLARISEPTQERSMCSLLEQSCAVDFESDDIHIKRAGEIAEYVLRVALPIKGAHNAFALYALLIEHNQTKAIEHFTIVLNSDTRNFTALRGLLAAWIQADEYQKVVAYIHDKQTLKYENDSIVHALFKLSSIMRWLTSIDDPSPLEDDLPDHSLLKHIRRYIGDKIDAILGRLYLVQGKAQQAAELLHTYASKHTITRLEYRYYVAWAYLLLNEKNMLATYFHHYEKWPSQWTIACLVLDATPSNRERNDLRKYLEERSTSYHLYGSIIKARLALIDTITPLDIEWEPGVGSPEEDIEAFRTVLGYALVAKDFKKAKQLIIKPLFRRLPLPDQLMWTGLLLLLTGEDFKNGCRHLEAAAHQYGYKRAALVLSAYFLEQHKVAEAKRLLPSQMEGSYNKTAILQAYIRGSEGHIDATISQIKNFVNQDEPSIHFLLGNLYFQQRKYALATQNFTKALNNPQHFHPHDCRALARCAEFLASPSSSVDVWQEVKDLSNLERQPMLVWSSFLALVWHHRPAELAILLKQSSYLQKHFEQLSEKAAIAVTLALLPICRGVEDIVQANDLINFLKKISQWISYPAVQHLCQIGITTALYTVCTQAQAQEKYWERIQQYMASQSIMNPANGSLALLITYTYMTKKYFENAIVTLRKVQPLDEHEQYMCSALARLLENEGQALHKIASLISNPGRSCIFVYDLIMTIAAFITGNFVQGYQTFLKLLGSYPIETEAVVKIERIFPYLCVYVPKEKIRQLQLIQMAQRLFSQCEDKELLERAARAMTLVVEGDQACQLLQKAIQDRGTRQTALQQTLVDLLCFTAIKAYNQEKISTAIHKLQEASRWENKTESKEILSQLVHQLESRVLADRFLTAQFPQNKVRHITPGRYHCLEEIIERKAALRKALRSKDEFNIKSAWGHVVQQYQRDSRFLHIRALIYKEMVLQDIQAMHAISVNTPLISTILWILLLCTEEFWAYFAKNRIASKERERVTLDEVLQEQLFLDALDTILSHHSTEAHSAFKQHNYSSAKMHLDCLDLCCQGDEKLIQTLRGRKIPFDSPRDQRRLKQAITQAEMLLNEWCTALIQEAKNILKNPEVIKTLPSGIPLNYEGGIQVLEPFIRLDIPVTRILTLCLEWYNEWCIKLSWRNEFKRIQGLTLQAQDIANRLAQLAKKGQDYKPENQVLAWHFFWQGEIAIHIEEKKNKYKEALLWNSTFRNAQDRLKQLLEDDDDAIVSDDEEEDFDFSAYENEGDY